MASVARLVLSIDERTRAYPTYNVGATAAASGGGSVCACLEDNTPARNIRP